MDTKMLTFVAAQRDVSDDELEVLVVFKNDKGKMVNCLLRAGSIDAAVKVHDTARAAHAAALEAAGEALQQATDVLAEAARVAAIEQMSAA